MREDEDDDGPGLSAGDLFSSAGRSGEAWGAFLPTADDGDCFLGDLSRFPRRWDDDQLELEISFCAESGEAALWSVRAPSRVVEVSPPFRPLQAVASLAEAQVALSWSFAGRAVFSFAGGGRLFFPDELAWDELMTLWKSETRALIGLSSALA